LKLAKERITVKDVVSEIKGMTVFNANNVDTTKERMFFGKPLGVQRYDVQKYPVFYRLTQDQLGAFWRPEEFPLQKDRTDYLRLPPDQKHIFTSNLKYQIMLDSVQGRGPGMAFIPYCSLPELESCMIAWQFMEMIHSYSYTYIIKNVYTNNPSEVLDHIIDDEKILERASSITASYDDFINSAQSYGSSELWKFNNEGVPLGKSELYEVKRKLYRAVMNVNILEGIRFYVSFACSFAFGELELMENSAKIISKIALDERLHLFLTQNILTKWKNGDDPEMIQIAKEEEALCYRMFENTVNEEKRWANYLFRDGSMIGLSEKLLSNYIEWIANRRMKAIGFKPLFDIPSKNNPLPWTEKWLNSKNEQVPPQEENISSYVVGGIKQDVSPTAFANFKL
jgi:ribonucleotide reductase beta subunit family protein with ferritin-like domain